MSARRSGIQNANCAYLAQASETTGGALNQNGQRSTHLIFGSSPMNCLRQRGEDLRRSSGHLAGQARRVPDLLSAQGVICSLVCLSVPSVAVASLSSVGAVAMVRIATAARSIINAGSPFAQIRYSFAGMN